MYLQHSVAYLVAFCFTSILSFVLYAVFQVLTSQQEVEEGSLCPVDSSDNHTCEDSELEEVPPYLIEEHAHGEEHRTTTTSTPTSLRCELTM